MNRVRKRLVKRPQNWRWSDYGTFALDKATVAASPVPIHDVLLPQGYLARDKPAVKKALTVLRA